MSKLPKNWSLCTIEDVVKILDNQRIPINSTERLKRIGSVPYYGATGQVGWIDDYIFNEELVLIGEDGAPFFDKLKNIAFIISGKSWVNNHAHVLKAKKNITSNKFLKHFLNQFDYTDFVKGTTRLKLNQSALKLIPFLLPPFKEQKRIVKKLDELLTKVESANERLDKIPAILKKFRQSVLHAAVTGELTKEWRELLELDNQWSVISLKEVISSLEQGWSPKCEIYPSNLNEEWAVIKTTAVQGMKFVEQENKKLPDTLNPRRNLELKIGDFLITRAGPRVRAGICCLIRSTRPNLMACDKVYRFRVNESIVNRDFMELVLNSHNALEQIESMKTGISDSGVNLTQKKFLGLKFSLPTLDEQLEISSRVIQLFSKADQIEARYKKAKQYTDKLSQSILAKAFSGELVPQDPNDEPAEKLLERIRQEKANIKRKK